MPLPAPTHAPPFPAAPALRRANLLALACAACLAGAAGAAEPEADAETAQGPGAGASAGAPPAETALPTVIVTAEKRRTAQQDTPLAVSTVGADAIERGRVETIKELMGEVPGLVAPGSISNMQTLFIRGIGTSNVGFYPAVAVYVDDVYRPRPFGVGTFSLPDIERIEVLRGPQGTLYGQNSSAGALKFVSRDPDGTRTGTVSLGVGNDGYRQASAYLAGPLGDGPLSAGLALASRRTDGYTYNAHLDRQVDATRLDQARLKLRFDGGGPTTATLSLDYGRDRSDNALYVPVGYPGADERTTFAGIDTRLGRTDKGAALHVERAIDPHLTLRSITGYRRFSDDPSPWDQDGTPEFAEGWVQNIDQKQFSQELQLGGSYERLFFTLGAVYFREHLLFDRLTVINDRYSELASDLESESAALYGQAELKLGDAWGLVAGLRASRDEQSFGNQAYRNTETGERVAQDYAVAGLSERWSSLTPKIGVNRRWANGLLGYFNITRGEKIGGYNRAASTAEIAALPVGPEEVTAYELGAKRRAWNDRLETSVAAFYNDFEDYQANVTNPVVNGQYIAGAVVVNAAKAHTWGVEFEGAVRLTPAWDVRASAAYLRTRFDAFENPTGAASTDYTGNELPSAPRWTASLGTTLRLPLPVPGEVLLSANARYVDAQYSDIGNTPILRIDPQTYVGAGVSYRSADGHWTVSLTSTNLLDRTYPVNLKYRAGVSHQAAYNPPRQTVLGLRYDY